MDSPTPSNGAHAASDEPVRRVADAAHDVADRAKQAAQQKIEQGAERTASSLGAAADSLRRAADDVRGEHTWISSLLQNGANGLDSAAQALDGGDVQRGLDGLARFARREPALFLGASLALGFALARVGKTALERGAEENAASPGGAGNGYG